MAKKANKFQLFFGREERLIKEVHKLVGKSIGSFVVGQIRKLTRAGLQLEHKASTRGKQPILENETVAQRAKLAELNRTSRFFSPGDSNLTFTGQLLNALTHSVSKRGSVIIEVKETTRRPYVRNFDELITDKKSRKVQKPLTNAELQGHLEDQGRGFLAVDKELEKQIADRIDRAITREFKKLRKS